MNIEEEIFNTYEVNKDKLIEYGFINEGDKLQFKKNILDNKYFELKPFIKSNLSRSLP